MRQVLAKFVVYLGSNRGGCYYHTKQKFECQAAPKILWMISLSSTFYFTKTCGSFTIHIQCTLDYLGYLKKKDHLAKPLANLRFPPRSGNLLPRHVGLVAGFSSLRPEEQKAPPAWSAAKMPFFMRRFTKKRPFKNKVWDVLLLKGNVPLLVWPTEFVAIASNLPKNIVLASIIFNIRTISIALVFFSCPTVPSWSCPNAPPKSGHLKVHPQGGRQRWQWFQVASWTTKIDVM